jgi:hypothetical protein
MGSAKEARMDLDHLTDEQRADLAAIAGSLMNDDPEEYDGDLILVSHDVEIDLFSELGIPRP